MPESIVLMGAGGSSRLFRLDLEIGKVDDHALLLGVEAVIDQIATPMPPPLPDHAVAKTEILRAPQ